MINKIYQLISVRGCGGASWAKVFCTKWATSLRACLIEFVTFFHKKYKPNGYDFYLIIYDNILYDFHHIIYDNILK
jgi:hypothetical protein